MSVTLMFRGKKIHIQETLIFNRAIEKKKSFLNLIRSQNTGENEKTNKQVFPYLMMFF